VGNLGNGYAEDHEFVVVDNGTFALSATALCVAPRLTGGAEGGWTT
jgi:hypothetical protein